VTYPDWVLFASAKISPKPLIPLSSQIDKYQTRYSSRQRSIKNHTQKLMEFATGVTVYLTLFFAPAASTDFWRFINTSLFPASEAIHVIG